MGKRINTITKLFFVICFALYQMVIIAQVQYERNSNSDKIDLNLLKDIDGNEYKVVRIGDQVWMAENLRTNRFRNGDKIDNIKSDDRWARSKKAAWSWYKNAPSNDTLFGKLYNLHAVNDLRCLCPEGWHIPSKEEWNTLIDHVQFTYQNKSYSKLLKSEEGWHQNQNNNKKSGFSAFPGGFRTYRYWDKRQYNPFDPPSNTTFYFVKYFGVWWNSNNGYFLLGYDDNARPKGLEDSRYSAFGFSVRCIKDSFKS
jgi:uncharacterized protein (TIGR02145 family)